MLDRSDLFHLPLQAKLTRDLMPYGDTDSDTSNDEDNKEQMEDSDDDELEEAEFEGDDKVCSPCVRRHQIWRVPYLCSSKSEIWHCRVC